MSEYIFVTNIFEYSNIRIYSSHSDLFTEESTAKEIGELKDRLHSQTFAFCLGITMIQEVDLILRGHAGCFFSTIMMAVTI